MLLISVNISKLNMNVPKIDGSRFDRSLSIADNWPGLRHCEQHIMVQISFAECSGTEWTHRVSAYRELSLIQCGEFGETKSQLEGWSVERGTFIADAAEVGAFQILIKELPVIGGGLAWLNRGPLMTEPGHANDIFAALKRHYADERGYYLRIAPAASDEEFTAPAGFQAAGANGWASAILDLTPDADKLRSNLRRNWRSHLNKAGRSELAVSVGVDGAPFDTFLESYTIFMKQLGLNAGVAPAFFARLQGLLPPEDRMRAYVAELDGDVVAGVLIAGYGDTAEYIAAHSTDAGRKLGAGQLLLWNAIADAKEAGFARFDLSGMDAEQTPAGIYKFKDGVGAIPYRLAPEIEALGQSWGGLPAKAVRWRVRRARLSS